MNKKIIYLIIFLAVFSLVCALLIQIFWIRDAWRLKEEHFDERVRIAMQNVVDQLSEQERFFLPDSVLYGPTGSGKADTSFYSVPVRLLDSLIQAEFPGLTPGKDYHFGIYNTSDSHFILTDNIDAREEIFASEHSVSLSCICDDDQTVLGISFPRKSFLVIRQVLIMPIMSGLFLLVLVLSFIFTIYFILREKKLTEMKNDFVNNMTHEFKTPISTISVSSELLMKLASTGEDDKVYKYAGIIFNENQRLKNQVEKILQIALLNTGELKLNLEETDIHEIISDVVENFRLILNDRNGSVTLDLNAHSCNLLIDRIHFRNIITNLLDNANKYTPNKPEITVRSQNENGKCIVSVSDNGIGISRENQKDIFKQFHRVSTGNLHDVKGFGLGLYYVRQVTEAMGGTISVKSELKKGSRFDICFPV